ncbi:MAG: HEAT repeat domain-containing protein, partial [Spirochaetota bacterium]
MSGTKRISLFLLIILICLLNIPSYLVAQDNTYYTENTYIPITRIRMYIDILQNDPDYEKRARAAYNLGRIKSDIAIDSLINSLKSDKNAKVRSTCAYALGKFDKDKTINQLVNSYKNDTNPEVKKQALYSINTLTNKNNLTLYINALNEDNKEIKKSALNILSIYNENEVSSALKSLIETEQDQNIKYQAVLSLHNKANKSNLEFLYNLYENTTDDIIKTAVSYSLYSIYNKLKLVSDKNYINIIRNYFTTTKNDKIKLFSANTLLIMGDRISYNYLEKLYNDPFTRSEDKRLIQKTYIKCPFLDIFKKGINKLNSELLEERIYTEMILILSDPTIISQHLLNTDDYNNYLSEALLLKLNITTDIIHTILNDYIRTDQPKSYTALIKVILNIDSHRLLQILNDYLSYNSVIAKINIIYILSFMDNDKAFNLIKTELNNSDPSFLIRTFKYIDKTGNHRLLPLFYDNLIADSEKLRNQSLKSIINITKILINKLDSMFDKSLGKVNPEINSLIELINKQAIIPLYITFTQYIHPNIENKTYNNYLGILRKKDELLLETTLPNEVSSLITKEIVTLLNKYRNKVYYTTETYIKLYNIFIDPLLINVFIRQQENKSYTLIKYLLIPTLSKLDTDALITPDLKLYLINEIENTNKSIKLQVAKNIVYIIRSIYKPVDTDTVKVIAFKNKLSQIIIKIANYLNQYIQIYERLIDNTTENNEQNINLTQEELNIIIKGLNRALSEAIIIDKELYLQILETNIDSNIKIILISKF